METQRISYVMVSFLSPSSSLTKVVIMISRSQFVGKKTNTISLSETTQLNTSTLEDSQCVTETRTSEQVH